MKENLKHTVVHNFVPVFSGDDTKKCYNSFETSFEICMAIEHLTVFYTSKTQHTPEFMI